MRVVVAQRSDPHDTGVRRLPLDTLLEEADVVVVACSPDAGHAASLDEGRLALLKPSALLVNIARGPIVDQPRSPLRCARVDSPSISDVFEHEPVDPGDPILSAPGLVGAPPRCTGTSSSGAASVSGAIVRRRVRPCPVDVANPEAEVPAVPGQAHRGGTR